MESLFLHNYRPLCLFALHYLNDTDAAEDVVQECFTALWEKSIQEHRCLTAKPIYI